MTADEIIKCEIPNGTHKAALCQMQDDIRYFYMTYGDTQYTDDLLASFEALYELASGRRILSRIIEDENDVESVNKFYAEIEGAERKKAIADCLRVVDEVTNKFDSLSNMLHDKKVAWASELTRRLTALQPKEQADETSG